MAKQAVDVYAEVVYARCPCGGHAVDKRTGSYTLTSDSTEIACDFCDAKLTLGRRARLFS